MGSEKPAKHRVNPSRFNALLEENRKLRAQIVPAPKPPMLIKQPVPPEPYRLRFPLDLDQWITVESNRPLQPKHWDRLAAILMLQRETLCAVDETWQPLIPDDCGLPTDAPPPLPRDEP